MQELHKLNEEIYQSNISLIHKMNNENKGLIEISKAIGLHRSVLRTKLRRDNIQLNKSPVGEFLDVGKKICSRCKIEKDYSEFYKGSGFNGRQAYCKSCACSSEKIRLTKLKKDPNYVQSQKDYRRNQRLNNRASYLFRACKTRAKQQNIPFNLTIEDIVIPEFCPILGIKLSLDKLGKDKNGTRDFYVPSVDKIVPELGYVKGNIMIISMKANVMKNDATKEELLAFCKYFIEKYDK